MTDLIQLMKTVSIADIEQQIQDLNSKRKECDENILILTEVLYAAKAAQLCSARITAKPTVQSPFQPDRNVAPPTINGSAIRRGEKSYGIAPPQQPVEDVASASPVEPPRAFAILTDTSGAVMTDLVGPSEADRVLDEAEKQGQIPVEPPAAEIAAPPAEVVTTPKAAPEPPITKPRTLSPDARNQKISIGDRAKLYLEFAYNATAMAIGNGIDLPDPTQMAKHLQKDSRFVKDPRGFWKLAGT